MKVVITGADGQLGLAFQKELALRGIPFFGTDVSTCDITSAASVTALLDAQKPAVFINCAAYNLVDDAETKQEAAFAVNAGAVSVLAQACAARGVKLVHYGTDYVFDGLKYDLYTETDTPQPLNVYGRSKLEGENAARAGSPENLVLRTSWVYGEGKQNFLYKVAQWAQKNRILRISADEVSVPTSAEDLVLVTLKALDLNLKGLYHLTSSGYASRYEMAKYFLKAAGLNVLVIPVPLSCFAPKVARPLFSAMSSAKIAADTGLTIPHWQQGIDNYIKMSKAAI